ncbi:hypothetical protein [Halomonas salipaludis]|uniref:hypothetical protein n=1 Tax=Halomonas salipaludis TaxID=2032625 RepID=UPI001C3EE4BA|nr:hypothetical protein [Halomonas salipaludis]
MFNTSPKEALPPMRAGERESRAGGEQYCLSPLPLPVDSEHGVDVAHIDVRHDDVTMDIRQGASPESLMTAGHVFSFGSVFMSGFFLLLLMIAVAKGSLYEMVLIGWGALFRLSVGVCHRHCCG